MSTPPKIRTEQALNLLKHGYLFTSRVRRKAGAHPNADTPVNLTLMGKRATLLRGEEGVKLFYDTDKVKRAGAMPKFIQVPLFGSGAVHTLDGEAHRVRKNALADQVYEDEPVARFKTLVAEEVQTTLDRWRQQPGNVYDDFALAYGRAAFRWAGISVSTPEMERQARSLSRLLDNFGTPKGNPVAWVERWRADRWYRSLIAGVRAGEINAPASSALASMAELRDEHGELVDEHTAGVELQNLTRPTIAVSRFAAFAAVSLVEHPEWAERIRVAAGEELIDIPEATAFAQEVRRTYPFVPMLPALATTDTEIKGCPIRRGQRILLDILGTNTAHTEWEDADTFDPARFLDAGDAEQLGAFIPQGGGEVRSGHRCPGEKIAVTALSVGVAALARSEVQVSRETEDQTFSWTQFLTRPATGVRVHLAG
ncbi:Fatty-acid peroxygenase [Corynebacterium occultum]|uniref:Fatty-acid peroxygenase n=1 Tax=Corynebacterium occultum TaxID=2675219 RepID=A0A6B8W2A6_9CORY|nr:cytochrome P450 [Corynebacterium occultum]QGU06147.1 Fatty-acid peroxygenase [Corynebacterium occultum]